MLYDASDILIELKNEFRQSGESSFTIVYADLDKKLDFVEGSTQQYLEKAAEESGFDVITRGASRAELKKRPQDNSLRLERG